MPKNIDSKRFVEERSRALAVMYLTRRDDLVIREERNGNGRLDLIVQIIKDYPSSYRVFGVEVKGTAFATTDVEANLQVRSTLQCLRGVEEVYFPVCVFFFTMADNKGRYAWIAEPIVTSDGMPKLERRTDVVCELLDNDSLNSLVERVDHWYEALGETLFANERA